MSYRTENYEKLVSIIRAIPAGTYFSIPTPDGDVLNFMVFTQADVRALMSALPHAFWKKEFYEGTGSWRYKAQYEEIHFKILGVQEAPPTCKAIEEEYEVEEKVIVNPDDIEYETKTVTKTRIRYECGDEVEATEGQTSGQD